MIAIRILVRENPDKGKVECLGFSLGLILLVNSKHKNGKKSARRIINPGDIGKIVNPIVLSQGGTGGGARVPDEKPIVTTLGVPAHQPPDLARPSLKPCFPLHLVSPSPFFGFGPVGFISHRSNKASSA